MPFAIMPFCWDAYWAFPAWTKRIKPEHYQDYALTSVNCTAIEYKKTQRITVMTTTINHNTIIGVITYTFSSPQSHQSVTQWKLFLLLLISSWIFLHMCLHFIGRQVIRNSLHMTLLSPPPKHASRWWQLMPCRPGAVFCFKMPSPDPNKWPNRPPFVVTWFTFCHFTHKFDRKKKKKRKEGSRIGLSGTSTQKYTLL